MSEPELAAVRPLAFKKKILIGIMLGSLLMTAGFLVKSGLVSKTAKAVTGWYQSRQAAGAAAEAAEIRQRRQEEDFRAKLEQLRQLPLDKFYIQSFSQLDLHR